MRKSFIFILILLIIGLVASLIARDKFSSVRYTQSKAQDEPVGSIFKIETFGEGEFPDSIICTYKKESHTYYHKSR